jgi:superfamily I DNA and/or RNA helicase
MIMIVSTVRTDERYIEKDKQFGLGFLHCCKRMNVAISRARSLLVVFGKEKILTQDKGWKYLIEYAKENGTYRSENFY